MSKQETSRCADCGAHSIPIDEEGLCASCFAARGLRLVADFEPNSNEQPYRPKVIGQRLAAIIATAALYMPQGERYKLWLECCRLLGPIIKEETNPELYAVISSLRDVVPDEAQAAKWN